MALIAGDTSRWLECSAWSVSIRDRESVYALTSEWTLLNGLRRVSESDAVHIFMNK